MTLETLWEQFRRRDRRALARLLTLAADADHAATIRRWLCPNDHLASNQDLQLDTRHSTPITPHPSPVTRHSSLPPKVIAFTGSGGVGKSTLIGKLIELLRSRAQTVAVLACDPQSPLTGGSLFGDRVRMPTRPDDSSVFIRSLAVPSGHSGVAPNIDLMIRLLAVYGFDTVIVETVGAGQGETAAREVADVLVLLVQPETGDELQWLKAGLLEVADIVVVHKADLPGAERVEAQLRDLLNLPGCRAVPVLRVSAKKTEGVDELWMAIENTPGHSKFLVRYSTFI